MNVTHSMYFLVHRFVYMYLTLSCFLKCPITSKRIITKVKLVLPVSRKASWNGLAGSKKECLLLGLSLWTLMFVISYAVNLEWWGRLGTGADASRGAVFLGAHVSPPAPQPGIVVVRFSSLPKCREIITSPLKIFAGLSDLVTIVLFCFVKKERLLLPKHSISL